jgi:DNA processing protein
MLPKEEHQELFYQLALTFVPGIGVKTGKLLLERYGSATAIFNTSVKELKNISGITEVKAKGFKDTEVMT